MNIASTPKTKIQQLKAARDHLIARYKLLTPFSDDWYMARKQLQQVTEEGEIMAEVARVTSLKESFEKAFPSTYDSSQDWQCPICKEWKKNDPSSWLHCCSRRICMDCRKDQEKSKKCPACESKDNFPLNNLDELYYLQDKKETWAYFRMGRLLQQGGKHEESAKYLRLAADEDHPIAIYHLGSAYYTGSNSTIPQSNQKAKEYFLKSAQMGYVEAQYHLGLMCFEEVDDDEANNVDTSAAVQYTQRHQLQEAQKQRRRMQIQQEGLRWISLAAQGGSTPAQAMLASLYCNAFGRQAPVKKNLFLAKYWSQKGADKDDGSCQLILAQTLMVLASQTFDGSYNRVGYNPIPRVLFLLRKTAAEEYSSVQTSTSKENAMKTIQNIEAQIRLACAACNKQDGSLSQCNRCRAAFYCGKECLTKHWKMGHKVDCLKKEETSQLEEYLKNISIHQPAPLTGLSAIAEDLAVSSPPPTQLAPMGDATSLEFLVEPFSANNLN
jgi:TPR repeat protein